MFPHAVEQIPSICTRRKQVWCISPRLTQCISHLGIGKKPSAILRTKHLAAPLSIDIPIVCNLMIIKDHIG